MTGGPGKESEGRQSVTGSNNWPGVLLVGVAPMTSWHRDF